MESLPVELLVEISKKLRPVDNLSLASANKRLYNATLFDRKRTFYETMVRLRIRKRNATRRSLYNSTLFLQTVEGSDQAAKHLFQYIRAKDEGMSLCRLCTRMKSLIPKYFSVP